jgi:fructosamine-3-kinase
MTAATYTKSHPGAPADFFAAEARGLCWLAEVAGGPAIPVVREVGTDHIVIDRIEQCPPEAAMAADFGHRLATMHRAGPSIFGLDAGGYIGPLRLDNTTGSSWPEWYAERRVLPYVRMAVDRGALRDRDAYEIERACTRILPTDEGPARIHGDLWSGNVLWGADGQVWLIDAAAAHGGHRETDLAMLTLFGAPDLERILAAYDETWPLTDGWRQRVAVHQLHPLLVHAVLFGAGYGDRAVRAARSLTG